VTAYVRPKKSLGQHFLADANIARKIAGSLTGQEEYKTVIEIGPGTGMLSVYLMNNDQYEWYGMDVDHAAITFLHERYPGKQDNIINADFLSFDWQELLGNKQVAVIGNFPYNISTQIIFRVLKMRDKVPELVGMFQKEVARRIASPPGSKEYGILSVLTQAFYDVELLFNVEPHVFVPPPKVQSSVIRLWRKKEYQLDCNEKRFFAVVKTAFNQRRKTLRNSLKSLQVNWDMLPEDMPGNRPERLSVDDFVQITRQVSEQTAQHIPGKKRNRDA
jgi:16S rRNA (adenine1518-N6/adenine1519-N6)-dimethyltransferase